MAEIYDNNPVEATRIGWNMVQFACIGNPDHPRVVHDHTRGKFYFTDEEKIEHLDGIVAKSMMEQVALDFRREGNIPLAEATEKGVAMGNQETFAKLYQFLARKW